jgi:hypothetical protein
MTDQTPVSLREYLERIHGEYASGHQREHIAHADAHEREHRLNKEAIDKAEASVDKAVGAARETTDRTIEAIVARIDHSEAEQRRQSDELKETIHQLGLAVAGIRTTADNNTKSIQGIQDSQVWVVRLVGGAILLALLALIFKPGIIS